MGDAQRRVPLQAPSKPREERQRDLIADVAWCVTQVSLTLGHAEGASGRATLLGELGEIRERLQALHLVVLVEGGWCPRCATALTEPGRSPSRTHHCRRCRLGWVLVEDRGRVRAIARAWPASSPAPAPSSRR